jgi:hypothetical protein
MARIVDAVGMRHGRVALHPVAAEFLGEDIHAEGLGRFLGIAFVADNALGASLLLKVLLRCQKLVSLLLALHLSQDLLPL